MKERGSQPRKDILPFIPKAVRVTMATGIVATAIPAWVACDSSKDTLPEPTRIGATATPTPEDMPTLVLETQTPELIPTPTGASPEPTAFPLPEIRVDVTSFLFGEGVSPEEQQEIKDGVVLAIDWLYRKARINVDNVSVFAFANPTDLIDKYLERTIFPQDRNEAQRRLANATAFAGEQRDIFIITSSPGWVHASPIIGGPAKEGHIHTLLHEYFHIFQREVKGYIMPFPHWLNEGSAHYVAAVGLDDNEIYPYARIREGHLKEAASVKEVLNSMESAQGFYNAGSPYADEYSLGFLAVELLLKGLADHGVPDLAGFWEDLGKGTSWQIAFKSSFGKTPDQFYKEFEEWRQGGFQEKLVLGKNYADTKERTPISISIPEIVQMPTLPSAAEASGINSKERHFIENIKSQYGMDVELEFSSLYDTPRSDLPEWMINRYVWGPKPKEHLTAEELDVLKEAIDTIPFCTKINSRLKVIKDPILTNHAVESGQSYFRGVAQPKTQESKSIILLIIRGNSPLDGQNLKPRVSGINTGAERLRNVYYHECGHFISYAVLEAAFPKEFFDITDPSKFERQYKIEQKNPLYIPFAKLEGWRLREEIFIKEEPDERVYVKESLDNRMFFGHTNVSIAEHFAELFGLYISNSSVLTDEERMFFGKIKRGFEINPEGFAKAVAQDPMMLLRNE